MTSTPVLVEELYALCQLPDSADSVQFLFEHFDDWTKTNQLERIDEFLDAVDVTKVTNVVLVGLVRVPYLAHRHLKKWRATLEKVDAELHKRGQPSKKLLAGLF